jgi:hypothetical protein
MLTKLISGSERRISGFAKDVLKKSPVYKAAVYEA